MGAIKHVIVNLAEMVLDLRQHGCPECEVEDVLKDVVPPNIFGFYCNNRRAIEEMILSMETGKISNATICLN